MVLVDGTARFIDWMTAKTLEQCLNDPAVIRQGMDEPFLPDDPECWRNGRRCDLFCFAYSIIALSFDDEYVRKFFKNTAIRRDFIIEISAENYAGCKVAQSAARLILTLEDLHDIPDDYSNLLAFFQIIE
jgi:hypothetical protein